MNRNDQIQMNRDKELALAARREEKMERVDDPPPALNTRDLASGAAAARAKNDADLENKREPEFKDGNNSTPLFETGEAESMRSRWATIQTQFVDEPRRSVEQADELVAATMKRLAEMFASERDELEHNWDRGDDVSTE